MAGHWPPWPGNIQDFNATILKKMELRIEGIRQGEALMNKEPNRKNRNKLFKNSVDVLKSRLDTDRKEN